MKNIKIWIDNVQTLARAKTYLVGEYDGWWPTDDITETYPSFGIFLDNERSITWGTNRSYFDAHPSTLAIPSIAPPIGLKPRSIQNRMRITEIQDAIKRYVDAIVPIPQEWFDELNDLIAQEAA